jgi:hypothetical protein
VSSRSSDSSKATLAPLAAEVHTPREGAALVLALASMSARL